MTEEPQNKRNKTWRWLKRPETTAEEFIELKRSFVRRWISYLAMTFLFFGSGALVGWLIVLNDVDHALQVFYTVLPIASGVIGYWFAEQRIGKNNRNNNKDEKKENHTVE